MFLINEDFHWCKTPACVNPPNEKSWERIASWDVLESCENNLFISEASSASKMNAASRYRVTYFGCPWQMYIKGTNGMGLPWDKTSAETELHRSMIQSINHFPHKMLSSFSFQSSKCWFPVFPTRFFRRSWPLPSRSDCSPPFGGRISVSVPWNSSSWPSSRSDRTIETDIEKDIISFLKKNIPLEMVDFCRLLLGHFFRNMLNMQWKSSSTAQVICWWNKIGTYIRMYM